MLRTLPGGWTQIGDEPRKVGVAVVLWQNSHEVAQVVVGENWISIQLADDRGPRMSSPLFMKHITAADRKHISGLMIEQPNSTNSVAPSRAVAP